MAGQGVGFERIRRVTGYLAQDTAKMNDSKQAEVNERVKHASVKGVDENVDISKQYKLQER